MRKKIFLFLMLSIFLVGIVSSQASYCCERTEIQPDGSGGAWCQNAPEEECDSGYRSVPTSCESTSYCKLGTCINTKEGLCMSNTPQKVCEDNGGVWNEKTQEELPQCQLGCCLIGDQAAYVTLTRCKQLSSYYGLEIDYRTNIQNEIECIASAKSDVKGACVIERDYERNCKMLTKKECQEMQGNETEFHEGFLCSAESLETICGPSKKTICNNDKVYFLDTCGNLANVYDASKINTLSYWEKITEPTCGSGSNNAGSATCGDCDYFLGSTCKEGNANYGEYICKDLGCYEGNKKIAEHGETWCETDKDDENVNNPGGRHFRMVCYNGEVSVEACADYRQEICIESSIAGFKTAACRANQWQDCYSQDNEKDCENSDKRDCKWIEGYSILKNDTGYTLSEQEEEYSCIPRYAPGFDFWEEETDAVSMCSIANDICSVEYYAGTFEGALTNALGGIGGGTQNDSNIQWKPAGDPQCMADCKEKKGLFATLGGEYTSEAACAEECIKYSCVDENGELREEWKQARQEVCVALGDCGVKENYVGKEGYFDDWEECFIRENVEEVSEDSDSGGLFGLFG